MTSRDRVAVLDSAGWDSFDGDHPAPTFFGKPAWAHSFSACHSNARAEAHLITLNGSDFVVPLVRIRSKLLPWKIYSGTPLGGYTAILSSQGPVEERDTIERCLTLLSETNVDSIELNSWPFAPICDPSDDRYAQHETSVIDLRDGSDLAISAMSGNSRRMAAQAVRRGVTCGRELGSDVVSTYFSLLTDSAARWGLPGPRVSEHFVNALVSFGSKDVEIWIARYEGDPIAGAILLYGSQEVHVWSAAMRGTMAVLRPNNLLHVEMIRAAASRGASWYNLGSSEGLSGVRKFKESLGAKSVTYRTYTHKSAAYAAYLRMRSLLGKPK
jgi:hypothetical protein